MLQRNKEQMKGERTFFLQGSMIFLKKLFYFLHCKHIFYTFAMSNLQNYCNHE